MQTFRSSVYWITVVLFTIALSVSMAFSRGVDEELYKGAELYAKVFKLIQEHSVEEVDLQKMRYGAAKGMARSIGDPYADFYGPEEYKRMKERNSGKYVGIGITLMMREDGSIEIVNLISHSPAYSAGIRPGDVILKVGDKPLAGLKFEAIKNLIVGDVGTKVTLTLLGRDQTDPRVVTTERAEIKTDYVTWGIIDKKDKIGYARLTGFTEISGNDLRTAIEKMLKEGMRGFVLDLRDNGGGLLSEAIAVSDFFIEEGTILSTRGKSPGATRKYSARKKGTLLADVNFPVVVLVNGYSASASEIVAGALQDYKRALILGEKTFGKNSVQNIIPLQGGKTALKLTIALYFTPKGRSLEHSLVPDREVVMAMDDWIEVKKARDEFENKNTDKPYHSDADKQLASAMEYIIGKLR